MRPWTVLLALLFCGAVRADEPPSALLTKAKAVLSRLEGEIRLPGLRQPVEVLRDRWGVAHLYAKNADDLFFAQGFVAAQDRLFQIDWWRRQGAGEMAEVLGPDAVAADRFSRLIRYRGDSKAEWASYSPDARSIAVAFTRGINACIDHMGDRLPIEFSLLGYAPKKWRPEDVLGRMSGVYMSHNFRNEVSLAQLVAAVGVEKARWLAPVDPARAIAPAAGLDLAGVDQRILAGYTAATNLLQFKPPRTESNNWVVSGARSVSGKPLLASDPHRAITLPSLRYLVHLNAPGWNVIGSGEPGLPGVAIGHNERIAWGFTIVGIDLADVYVESIDPKNPDRYRSGDRWEAMKIVREKVAVKGPGRATLTDREVELRFTHRGPILFQDAKTHRAFVLKWSGSEPGGAAYLASLALDRAGNRQEFLAAMGRWKIPGLNFVYADVDGNIGWIAAGLTPIRANHDGLLPVPGDEKFDWRGYLRVADLPQTFNPKEGFLATANHNILPPGYKHAIGHEFAAPYRFQRVRQGLESRKQWDLAGFKAIQHDHVSLPGQALARLLAKVDVEDALKPFARRLTAWDGSLSVDSPAGALYAVWLKELKEAMLSLHLPKDLHGTAGGLCSLPVLLRALETADANWFGRDARVARDRLVRTTFARAVKRTRELPGRWGAVHTATFRHPLGVRHGGFNLGPFERPGDEYTPNNTRHDDNFKQLHGATYRHLLDLADWDRGLATSAPGQSGQPGSPHYGDLAPLWNRGEYFPLAFSRKKVEEVMRHRLWLRPGK